MQAQRLENALQHMRATIEEIKAASGALAIGNAGAENMYIQVKLDAMLELPVCIKCNQFEGKTGWYPYELTAYFCGVKFCCLLDAEEYQIWLSWCNDNNLCPSCGTELELSPEDVEQKKWECNNCHEDPDKIAMLLKRKVG